MRKALLSCLFILTVHTIASAQPSYLDKLYYAKWDFEQFDGDDVGFPPEYYNLITQMDQDFLSYGVDQCNASPFVQDPRKYAGNYAGKFQSANFDSGCAGIQTSFTANLEETDTSFYIYGYYRAHLLGNDSVLLTVSEPSSNFTEAHPAYWTDLYNSASKVWAASDNSSSYSFFEIKYVFSKANYDPLTDSSVNFEFQFYTYTGDGDSSSYVLFDNIQASKNQPSGIALVNNASEASVFPNPVYAGEALNIINVPAGKYTFNVYDITGRRVLSKQLNLPGETSIGTTGIADGLYQFRLAGDNGVINDGKFVVQQ
jgi:hypothetical protein